MNEKNNNCMNAGEYNLTFDPQRKKSAQGREFKVYKYNLI